MDATGRSDPGLTAVRSVLDCCLTPVRRQQQRWFAAPPGPAPTDQSRPLRPARSSATSRVPASAPYEVEFDVRTVYDFVFSLSDDAGSTDDLPAADRAWLSEAQGDPSRAGRRRRSRSTGASCASSSPASRSTGPRSATRRRSSTSSPSLDDATIVRAIVAEDLRDPRPARSDRAGDGRRRGGDRRTSGRRWPITTRRQASRAGRRSSAIRRRSSVRRGSSSSAGSACSSRSRRRVGR